MAPQTLTVLSTPTCQRCKFVKRHLESAGVEFDYVDVTDHPEWEAEMKQRGLNQVPQTVKGEVWVEGVDLGRIDTLF